MSIPELFNSLPTSGKAAAICLILYIVFRQLVINDKADKIPGPPLHVIGGGLFIAAVLFMVW